MYQPCIYFSGCTWGWWTLRTLRTAAWVRARKVRMGEGRQYPNVEYYTVIMANQDTISETGSHWVPRVPWRSVDRYEGYSHQASCLCDQSHSGNWRRSPSSRLSPSGLPFHTLCSSSYSPGAAPGALFLPSSSCLLQAWFRGSHHSPAPQPHASQIKGGSDGEMLTQPPRSRRKTSSLVLPV